MIAFLAKPLAKWLGIGLAFALLGAWAMRVDHLRGQHKAAHAATIKSYRDAQALATDIALAARLADEFRTRQLAERTDDANDQLQVAGRDAVARYAAAHRVPRCLASPTSGTNPAALPVDPEGAAGTREAADMVAVSRPDLDQLTEAALRAATAREWAQSLIDRGLALPVEESGGVTRYQY